MSTMNNKYSIIVTTWLLVNIAFITGLKSSTVSTVPSQSHVLIVHWKISVLHGKFAFEACRTMRKVGFSDSSV